MNFNRKLNKQFKVDIKNPLRKMEHNPFLISKSCGNYFL